MAYVSKGTRVRVRVSEVVRKDTQFWLEVREFVGEVKHIRGDHPTHPTCVHFWVLPDGTSTEIEVTPRDIAEVLPCE
jgi:hypothetical protein